MPQNGNVNVRALALNVIIDVMENGAYSDKAIHEMLDNNASLEKRDRAFMTRLCEGTAERAVQIDYIINLYSKTKVKKMKPVIRNILRMGVYQIFYMDQVPDSAACNESVKLAMKRKFVNLKGFVNGVLRTIAREKDNIKYPDRTKEFVRYISVMYSMPEWIVEMFADEYGQDTTETIMKQYLDNDRYTSVRCNISKANVQEVINSLKGQNVRVQSGKLFDYSLLIDGYDRLTDIKAFEAGLIQVQDESSMVVGSVLDIHGGETLIDVCAAPGGKTLHAADLLNGTGKVISCDITEYKTNLIRDNVRRNGFDNVEVYVQDALEFRAEWEETADVIIADLPCSGLGVIGKKCDIKYKTKPEDITELAALQKKILQNISRYLKKGGRLIFSTCTIAKQENEDNVEWILDNLPFEKADITEKLPVSLRDNIQDKSFVQILPTGGTDGFFVSAFIKK